MMEGHETQGMSDVDLRWEQRHLFRGNRRGRERTGTGREVELNVRL